VFTYYPMTSLPQTQQPSQKLQLEPQISLESFTTQITHIKIIQGWVWESQLPDPFVSGKAETVVRCTKKTRASLWGQKSF